MRAPRFLLLLLMACADTNRELDVLADASADAGDDGGDSGPEGGATPPDYEVCGATQTSGVDEDCDGEPDLGCKIYLGAHGEDELGDALSAEDDDCDGRPDRKCMVTHWDEAERREQIELDEACDGALARCSDTGYTDDGIELDYRREYMCDVRYLGIESCRSAEYDEETRTARYSDDDTCDGDDESCTITKFDGDGQTVSVEVHEESCNGPVLRCARQERDGMVVTGVIDEGCDDDFEVCQRLEYTTGERPLTEEIDSRCNGPSPDDTCVAFAWGDEDNARISVDTGCDGTVDTCLGSVALFDDDGRLIARNTYDSSFSTGCDAPITCSTFEYDSDGNRVAQTLDFGCNGELGGERDNCTTWVYAGGKLVAEIADFRCDKSACTATRYQTETCF